MSIRKLRLERGWSQDQLAHISGLNIRTIQRLESGQPAGLESQNALASAFGVPRNQLHPEAPMTSEITTPSDQQAAIFQLKRIKRFYAHLIRYVAVISLLLVINLLTVPHYLWVKWAAFGWGLGLLFHGLKTFVGIEIFGADWEKRKLEKLLQKKREANS